MGNLYSTISDLCKQKGITGGKMCTDLGISKGTLTDLKMGRQKSLSAEKAQMIAAYLGVSVDYLLGKESKKALAEPKLSEGERMLIDLFREVPEDRQQLVLQMIRAALEMR